MSAVRIIAFCSLVIVAGCSSSATQQPGVVTTASKATTATTPAAIPESAANPPATPQAVAAKPKIDACALLTSKEVRSVQGEELQETKPAGQSAGGFSISQCFFTLPTFSNSISLMVAEKGAGPDATDPEEFWRDRFHEDRDRVHEDRERDGVHEDADQRDDKDKDRERAGGPAKRGEEEEEEGAPPQRISGVGEEAYWVGNRIGGALYVLKGDAYLRISIGGPPDQARKIRKSRILAAKALARL